MIYDGLNFSGAIETVRTGSGEIVEIYRGLNETNPIFYSNETISGVSPLTFKGLGLPLTDYQIYGNSAGCGEQTKNLLGGLGTSTTTNGVTFTVDSYAGTITANGRATQNTLFIVKLPSDVAGDFYYSGCPAGGATQKYDIYPWDNTTNSRPKDWNGSSTSSADNDFGEGMSQIKVVEGHSTSIVCRVYSGYNAQNLVFRPMLRIPSASKVFEPYGYKIPVTCGGETKNIYLGGYPLNKSGDDADDVQYSTQTLTRRIDPETLQVLETPTTMTITVPQFLTIVGDNTFTVDTTVQPSAISINGNIKQTN